MAIPACDDGYTRISSKCIRIFNSPSTWLSALVTCVKEGGILASVQSEEEQDTLTRLSPAGAWIGLSDIQGEGSFSWVDGAPLNYTKWRRDQPNNAGMTQHCVLSRPDGEWDDVKCSRALSFACQKNVITQ